MKRFLVILFLCSFVSAYSQVDGSSYSPEVRFKEFFSEANIHLMKGDDDKALSCFSKCLKLDPLSSVCNYEIARIYFGRRDYDSALKYGLDAYRLRDRSWYCVFLGAIYEQLGDYDNAFKFYELFLKENPTYDDYESFLSFQLNFRKFDDAISTLYKMENIFGYQHFYSLQRAEIFTQLNEIDRAADEYKRIINTDSTNLSAYGLLEELYYSHGKLAEAQEVQNKILRLDPNNPISHLSQAMLCRNSGKKDCFYENLVESFKSDAIPIDDKLIIISDIANDSKFFDEDQVEGLFQILNDFFPESPIVHTNFADFYLFVNKPDEALQQLELAVQHNLSDYKNYHTIFQLYFICEDYEGLRKFVDSALEMFPDVAEVYMYSAVADMGLGKYDDASDGFRNAQDFGIEFSPVVNDYRFYFGLYNYLLNNKKVAFSYFDQYINQGSLDWYFTLRYVYCLVDSRENLKRAESLLNSLNVEHHKYYFYYYVRAYYNFVKGDSKGAKADIALAVKLNPDNPAVQKLAGEIGKMN